MTLSLGLHSLATLAYPGGLLLCLLGAAAEVAVARFLGPGRGSLRGVVRALGQAVWPPAGGPALPPLAIGAALLVLLAATQVAAPFNPVPPGDRNLLVASAALATVSAAGLVWGRAPSPLDPRLMVLAQGAWLVAVLAPTLETPDLRPQVLGAVNLPVLLPLKVAAGLLYLLCLPPLLHLLGEPAVRGRPRAAAWPAASFEGSGFGLMRLLLWLPYCGLFSSLFLPAGGDDLLGLLRFFGVSLGAAAIAIATAANLVLAGGTLTQRVYFRVVAALAAVTAVLAIVTARL